MDTVAEEFLIVMNSTALHIRLLNVPSYTVYADISYIYIADMYPIVLLLTF